MLVIKFTICVIVLGIIGPLQQVTAAVGRSPIWDIETGGPENGTNRGSPNTTTTVRQIILTDKKEQPRRVIPIGQWSSRKRIGQFFTEWSPWSGCDRVLCQRQMRERLCRMRRKCADMKHVEGRPCQICKEQQWRGNSGGAAASTSPTAEVDSQQGQTPSTTWGHNSQTNNNTSAGHNHVPSGDDGGNSLERSADDDDDNDVDVVSKFDSIWNKFNPKLQRDDQMMMDDSEFHIIKINQKKIHIQHKLPEIQANKLLGHASTASVQILGNTNDSRSQTRNRDGWDLVPPLMLSDVEDSDTDSDYQSDDGLDQSKTKPNRRRLKNGQMVRKYSPVMTAVMPAGDPKGAYRVYTRWSKWSKCSGKCTTRRFKRCRMKEICGNEVLREVAYCYTEGSFCEEWIVRQMYSNVPKTPGQQNSLQTNSYPVDMASNRNSNSIQERKLPSRSGVSSGTIPGAGQCGIATAMANRRKPASHMLRIIGGRVVRKGSYPWQVAILNRFKEAFCGGTLISKQWILTAAHCVRKRLYVRLGEHNLETREGMEVEYRVEYAIRHPYYDKTTVDNDIALLRLPKEIIPSAYIGFACLPEKYQKLPVGTKCTIIGWGKRKNMDDAGTKYLHEAQVPIVTNEECKEVYDDYTITKNMFCAGHKRGRIDTCSGDSGGPLLCKDPTTSHWSILGVTSFGDGCGKRNKFGIYTKVSNYIDWIQSVIECSGNCRRF